MLKERVLLDSCVIIEAFRTGTWNGLVEHYLVETVDCCVIECTTGDVLKPGRTIIPHNELIAGLSKIHQVSDLMLATLDLEHNNLPALDDGEKHILAWLNTNKIQKILPVISTADKAAVRAVHVLNLLDQVTSLEKLALNTSTNKNQLKQLKDHFREEWLSGVRTSLKLGTL